MESTRTKTKALINEVKQIAEITKQLSVIVKALPDSRVKDAYALTLTNLETKNDKFLTVEQVLTDKQKEAIALIKTGKVSAEKVITDFSEVSTNVEKTLIEAPEIQIEKPSSKKGKK